MIRDLRDEVWKEIIFDDKIAKTKIYKISNFGRTLYWEKGKEYLRKKSFTNGYEIISLKQLENNKRTSITMIAKWFGVSDMQIHRIKSGENWGHVKI